VIGAILLLSVLVMPAASTRVADAADLRPAPVRVTPDVWAATADGATAEVLVLLDDRAELSGLSRFASKEARGAYVYRTLRQTAERSQASLLAWLASEGLTYRPFYIVNAVLVQADRDVIASLASRPEIDAIMTNPKVPLSSEPLELVSSPLDLLSETATIPWGVSQVRAPEAWALGYRGEGVVVAGQDTGYAWQHAALRSQYRGWNGVTADHDYNWHDAIHEDSDGCGADAVAPCDDQYHGTHTMGTIVGDDGADRQVGVAPGAKWIGCRNMVREGSGVPLGTPASYAECFEFFLAPYPIGGDPSEGDSAKAPHVINNSWSCPEYEGCDSYHIGLLGDVVNNVRAAGIMVVASAGNSGGAGCGTVDEPPAMYDAATTVGATGNTDAVASFSSRGTGAALIKPDIVAPGVSVLSTYPGNLYNYLSGTSMAAPHVAGVVALIWSARPDLRGEITATEQVLASSALPLTSTQCGDAADAVPNNVYGWGRVDALAAVLEATGTELRYSYVPLILR
jgi:subtilisin family serine protease